MPLLNIRTSQKVHAAITLESETAAKLDHYAALTTASADAVVESALEYLFAKDKDFQAHLAKHGGKTAAPSLRVKRPALSAARSTASSGSAESNS